MTRHRKPRPRGNGSSPARSAKRPRRKPQRDRTADRPAQRPASASPTPRIRGTDIPSLPVLLAATGTTVIGVPTEAAPRRGPRAEAPTRTPRPAPEPRAAALRPADTAPAAPTTGRAGEQPVGTAASDAAGPVRRSAAGRGKGGRGRTAQEAFDRLYAVSAGALLRQVELLTGDGEFARRAVAHAFDVAWQRWPEVARDADPVGWVRAAGHDFALAPWQRWMPAGRRPHPRAPGEPLAAALLGLPPPQRRAVLLHDGLGLDVLATATEVEATVSGAAARIAHAREELTAAVPGLGADALPERLGALLAADREPPEQPRRVRDASERGARRRTLAAFALTAVIALATAVAIQVGPINRAAPPPRSAVPAHPTHPSPAAAG